MTLNQTKSSKSWKVMSKNCRNKLKPNGMALQLYKITISINFSIENFDALKRYESTEVDRRTWLHVPSVTLWSTSSDTHQGVEIKKVISTKMNVYTILDWISLTIGTICAFRVLNLRQWSLTKQSSPKIEKWCPNIAETSSSQTGWCSIWCHIHTFTISIYFSTVNFDALKRGELTEVDCRTWLHVLSGTLWSTSSDTQQVVGIKKRLLLKWICHFRLDLINNMDHMRSAFRLLNTRQWSLTKQSSPKDEKWCPKIAQTKLKPNRMV